MNELPKDQYQQLKDMVKYWMDHAEKEGAIPLLMIFGRPGKDGKDEFRFTAMPWYKIEGVVSMLEDVLENTKKDPSIEYWGI